MVGCLGGILETLRDQFDIVVVNTGAFWSDTHAVVLENADAVAFVVDQRPSSLRATVHAVEICARVWELQQAVLFSP